MLTETYVVESNPNTMPKLMDNAFVEIIYLNNVMVLHKDNAIGLNFKEDVTTLLQYFFCDLRITLHTIYGY